MTVGVLENRFDVGWEAKSLCVEADGGVFPIASMVAKVENGILKAAVAAIEGAEGQVEDISVVAGERRSCLLTLSRSSGAGRWLNPMGPRSCLVGGIALLGMETDVLSAVAIAIKPIDIGKNQW